MPQCLLKFLGYVIYFWIGDGDEPIHVHISKGVQTPNATKVWLTEDGAEIANNNSRISDGDLKKLLRYITYNQNRIVMEWLRRFGKGELKH